MLKLERMAVPDVLLAIGLLRVGAKLLENLFVPLSFASVGLNLNPAFLERHPEVIAALILAPLV